MNEDTYLLDDRDYLNLTCPDTLHLMSTQEEEWVISAVQPVSRYIKVEGQVGDAEIDVVNRKAIVEGLTEGGYPESQLRCVASFNEAMSELQPKLKSGDVMLYENDLPDSFK